MPQKYSLSHAWHHVMLLYFRKTSSLLSPSILPVPDPPSAVLTTSSTPTTFQGKDETSTLLSQGLLSNSCYYTHTQPAAA